MHRHMRIHQKMAAQGAAGFHESGDGELPSKRCRTVSDVPFSSPRMSICNNSSVAPVTRPPYWGFQPKYEAATAEDSLNMVETTRTSSLDEMKKTNCVATPVIRNADAAETDSVARKCNTGIQTKRVSGRACYNCLGDKIWSIRGHKFPT